MSQLKLLCTHIICTCDLNELAKLALFYADVYLYKLSQDHRDAGIGVMRLRARVAHNEKGVRCSHICTCDKVIP